jgi:hypothetical protein
MKKLLPALLCILSLAASYAQVDKSNIQKHIKVLASDSLEGRGTGTAGEKLAATYIQGQFKKIGIQPQGDNKLYTQSFPFKSGVHGEGKDGTAYNVVGYIDNKAASTIIIGAHYDHLGLGVQGSSLDANPANKIHNGADDNASGTSGVIELARYFQNNRKKEKYNFLFICFSGEELGLFGSKYFTEHPTIDLTKVDYMVNMDMVGRLNAGRDLSISGTGTSAAFEPLLKKLTKDKFNAKMDSSGTGPSDHTSFYLKNIPVLHFFTGSHNDYHKPSDDADKINYEGEVDVLNLIIKMIEELDSQPKLAFLQTKSNTMNAARSFKVTMGVMPSYTATVEGLQVDGVTEGRPAQKAGILPGDVIVQIGDRKIKDIEQYMEALGVFDKGQTVPVKIIRDKKEVTVSLTF